MIVLSHRGPASFTLDADGSALVGRGAGGMASGLRNALRGHAATWVAAALTEGDRVVARSGPRELEGLTVHLLALDERAHRMHYDLVSNGLLWPVHHGLLDAPHRPWLDRRARDAWEGYVAVNQVFAETVAGLAPEGERVLVQDYHLYLVPGLLRASRPDLSVSHFSHTPFGNPDEVGMLPDAVASSMCTSLATVACGFNSPRWASRYQASAAAVLGGTPVARSFSSPIPVDVDALRAAASGDEVAAAADVLQAAVDGRRMLLRVDRVEPSKNILRGFAAFDLLLEESPPLRGGVVFVALLHASRDTLPEYLAYRQEVEQGAARVNERWARGDWRPIVLEMADNFPRSLAAYGLYDVLLVNPVRDGLNLVAKEAPLLNRRDGVLCLSPTAGVYDEVGPAALAVHPFDLVQTAQALRAALDMDAAERASRAADLRRLASLRSPGDWLADLLGHATPAPT